jgi:hypothetical protein
VPKWFYILAAAFVLAGVLTEGPTYFLHAEVDEAGPVGRSAAAVTYLTLGALIADALRWLRHRRRSQPS